MAFDQRLAERVRATVARRQGVGEKRMFGGMAFLVEGRMFCGVIGTDLVVRVGPARWARALARPHVRPMDFTGKPLTGYVYVAPPGVRTAASLRSWVDAGLRFARALDRTPTRPGAVPLRRRRAPSPEGRRPPGRRVRTRSRQRIR